MAKTTNRSPSPEWPEAVVRHPPELAEAVTQILFEHGARALVQETALDGIEWISRAGFDPGVDRDACGERVDRRLADLADIFDLGRAPGVEWRRTGRGDWAEKWKEGLAPIEIGQRLVIKPSWCDYHNRSGRIVLEIDPGMAFGTGRHETTSLCLTELERLSRRAADIEGRNLDLGTGSGILALAWSALTRQTVVAVDNDFEALPVAADNLAANRLTDRIRLVCAGPEALRGSFNLVTANLTANTLIELCPEIIRLAAPRAALLLSGILIDQARAVEEVFVSAGCVLDRKLEKGEWVALTLIHHPLGGG